MTSEFDAMKTNEFLRRRKLRIQQVREQSKEIAKKIRQRAKVEKLRQVGEFDEKKQKEFCEHRDKLIRKLELYYASGVHSIGAGHKSASDVNLLNEDISEKPDLSKKRGREAAAELRRQKQDNLDKKKKILDRKLHAREVANEISREKSTTFANKLLGKSSSKVNECSSSKLIPESDKKPEDIPANELELNTEPEQSDPAPKNTDMATQWNYEELPNEWEPHVPSLPLQKDDSAKESSFKNEDNRSEKSKRLNLFALSDEMPSSLRGLSCVPEETVPVKPSLTLVSEYLQNRGLRLRESNTASNAPSRNNTHQNNEDLQSIKQTILKTRASRTKVRNDVDKSVKRSDAESATFKKNLVTSYNHYTRDTKDAPFEDRRCVVRDLQSEEDAYSLAVRETNSEISKDKDQSKKLQTMRSRLAVTKQSVEKEYRGTMQFLNTVPKSTSKPIKNAYKDERRIQADKENRQRKMQHEFRKIEKDCIRLRQSQSKSPSPDDKNRSHKHKFDSGDDFNAKDFQYSWMPVPESDGNFAVHTIPTTFKAGKSGNNVKFCKVDSYHEYRSRHKHTPPTKEQPVDRPPEKTAEVNDKSNELSTDTSDSSSDEQTENNTSDNGKITEAERLILSRILNSKMKKNKESKHELLLKHIVKSLSSTDKAKILKSSKESDKEEKDKSSIGTASLAELNEGVYKAVNQKGDNVTSMYFNENNQINSEEEAPIESGNTDDRCSCGKKKKNVQKAVTKQQGCGEGPSPGDENGSQVRKCSCEPQHKGEQSAAPARQPSAATSTASLQSAATDHTRPRDFLKILNDGAPDDGKFYIGASGTLQDHNYEVVIHLRKKNADNEEKKDTPSQDKLQTKQHTAQNTSNQESFRDTRKKADDEATHHVQFGTDKEPDTKDTVQVKSADNPTSIVTENKQQVPYKPTDADIPKSATSAYTQTVPETPDHHRAYNRMSSSTSTAYMSPPDMILPNLLKNNYRLNCADMCEPRPESRGHSVQPERQDSPSSCERYDGCRCRRCARGRHVTQNKPTSAKNVFIPKLDIKKIKTPMHSFRSNGSSNVHSIISSPDRNSSINPVKTHNRNIHSTFRHGDHKHKSKTKCRKCEHKSKTCIIRNHPKSRVNNATTRRGSLNVFWVNRNKTTSNHKNINKFTMNPIVKSYVDKLLEMNKIGIKAIEVMNQECSSVTTPGSSIIEEPRNISDDKSKVKHKISLEHLKDILKEQILEKILAEEDSDMIFSHKHHTHRNNKKALHKVKSLNISRHLLKSKAQYPPETKRSKSYTSLRTTATDARKQNISHDNQPHNRKQTHKEYTDSSAHCKDPQTRHKRKPAVVDDNRVYSSESDYNSYHIIKEKRRVPLSTSTQTAPLIDDEIKFMKLAEDKIHNMEKIADLTDKCTKRLSNLAKVLNEVRQNKFTSSQISDNTPELDQRVEKSVDATKPLTPAQDLLGKAVKLTTPCGQDDNDLIRGIIESCTEENIVNKPVNHILDGSKNETIEKTRKLDRNIILSQLDPSLEVQQDKRHQTQKSDVSIPKNTPSTDDPFTIQSQFSDPNLRSEMYLVSSSDVSGGVRTPPVTLCTEDTKASSTSSSSSDYTPFLNDIPRTNFLPKTHPASSSQSLIDIAKKVKDDCPNTKTRARPPPALTRLNLKHAHDYVAPHELSTVVEVDSPLSVKIKAQSNAPGNASVRDKESIENDDTKNSTKDQHINPDIIETSANLPKSQTKVVSLAIPEESKIQMMDLKQFNDIMLKPFISIQEYAKQCNLGPLEEGSNIEDVPKEEPVTDDQSSLHSDASLPDVIAELLKRNLINEPFKFDNASNINSTTMSSESTLSVLALSKVRKTKRKSSVVFQNKENIAESSDSLSISSNPDLENAFKKLGMGWASSTLKKTKERLALSSSSNTSSSSLSQFRIKSFKNSAVPVLVSDSISTGTTSKAGKDQQNNSKNVEQQTSNLNSMTVKDFLTNELAKKITFTNKSRRDDTEEFVSLYETKMPEEMKHASQIAYEERSLDSTAGSRARRTSTPVQLFRARAYHTSSSSNLSAGLFSNADDLSSVKGTSNSHRNHSTSEKDDLTIPNCSLRKRKGLSDCSKSD